MSQQELDEYKDDLFASFRGLKYRMEWIVGEKVWRLQREAAKQQLDYWQMVPTPTELRAQGKKVTVQSRRRAGNIRTWREYLWKLDRIDQERDIPEIEVFTAHGR